MTVQRLTYGPVTLVVDRLVRGGHRAGTVEIEIEAYPTGKRDVPGQPIERWTGPEDMLDEGLARCFDNLAHRTGSDLRWSGPLPGRDDEEIEMRAALRDVERLIETTKQQHRDHFERLRALGGYASEDGYDPESVWSAQEPSGRLVLVDLIVARANLLVALASMKRR